MANEEWKLVTEYGLHQYPNGLKQGDRVRLVKELVIHDHEGRATGVTHPVGEVWMVLSGVVNEPHVVWLLQPDGNRHTWDSDGFFDWFQLASTPGT